MPEWGQITIGGNRADVMGQLFGWYYRIGKYYQLLARGGPVGEANRKAEIQRHTVDALLMEYLLDRQDVERVRKDFIFAHPQLETHWTAG